MYEYSESAKNCTFIRENQTTYEKPVHSKSDLSERTNI